MHDGSVTPCATRLSPFEAATVILEHVRPLPVETLPLSEALGSVLGHAVQSPIDIPPWDNSAMDGYAVRGEDVHNRVPVELEIIDEIAAGAFPQRAVEPGKCSRIFTGAPLPAGADCVIRQEDTTSLGARRVRIGADRDVGRNVRSRGEDVTRGSTVLDRGVELRPAHLGVLASIAQREIPVFRRPRVAFLGAGDEIAELEDDEAILSGRKIASSNSYTMRSMIIEAGGEPVNLGIARDDPQHLRDHLTAAFGTDMLVTSAGVSVGDHDYLRSVFTELGGILKFWRIRMRPGAPVGFGLLDQVPWVGLPGNPVSTMVTFELFVRPAIRKMRGHISLFRRTVPVVIAEPITTQAPLQHFLRAVVRERDGRRVARLTGPQGSGVLTSMVHANALVIVPEDRQAVAVGETLDAVMFDEPKHVERAPY